MSDDHNPYNWKNLEHVTDATADERRAFIRYKYESRYGDVPLHERTGPYPKFWREEADLIIQDQRKIMDICADWNASPVTILKVKSRGKYAGIPYVARDEVDPDELHKYTREQAAEKAAQIIAAGLSPDFNPDGSPKKKPRGRPFKGAGGEDPLKVFSPEKIEKIAHDKRSAKLIAADYGISTPVVLRMKREYAALTGDGTHADTGSPIAPPSNHNAVKGLNTPTHIKRRVRNDKRSDEDVAYAYRLPVYIVKKIRAREF